MKKKKEEKEEDIRNDKGNILFCKVLTAATQAENNLAVSEFSTL